MKQVKREAERRKVELLILPTREGVELLNQRATNSNAILRVTCGAASRRCRFIGGLFLARLASPFRQTLLWSAPDS